MKYFSMEDNNMKRNLMKWILCILVIAFICILFINFKENILFKDKKNDNLISYLINKNENVNIDIFDDQNNDVIYSKNINVGIKNFDENKKYEIFIVVGENSIKKDLISDNEEIEVSYINEGLNSIQVVVYEEGISIYDTTRDVYYVEKYKNQFLDNLSFNGISTHFGDNLQKEFNNTEKLVKAFGIKYVRTDFFQKLIHTGEIYDFSECDKWVKKLTDNTGIKLLCLLNGVRYSDHIINSNEEVEDFFEFYKIVKNRYPNISDFEILNEINADSGNFKKRLFFFRRYAMVC